jgi:hypothetical protein
MLRLNLGAGSNHQPRKEGWINVDKYPPADIVCDLEEYQFVQRTNGTFDKKYAPWPWPESCVDEALFSHSLEHLGETTEGFFHIVKELYRVCKPGAKVTIFAPHPRHDHFMNDPTHVRIITPSVMRLFSKQLNAAWAAEGKSLTPLGLHLDVDFVINRETSLLDDNYATASPAEQQAAIRANNNVIKMFLIEMSCVK